MFVPDSILFTASDVDVACASTGSPPSGNDTSVSSVLIPKVKALRDGGELTVNTRANRAQLLTRKQIDKRVVTEQDACTGKFSADCAFSTGHGPDRCADGQFSSLPLKRNINALSPKHADDRIGQGTGTPTVHDRANHTSPDKRIQNSKPNQTLSGIRVASNKSRRMDLLLGSHTNCVRGNGSGPRDSRENSVDQDAANQNVCVKGGPPYRTRDAGSIRDGPNSFANSFLNKDGKKWKTITLTLLGEQRQQQSTSVRRPM